jgi:hypothetical protein
MAADILVKLAEKYLRALATLDLRRDSIGDIAEGLGAEGGLLVDVGLRLHLLVDVGLRLHLLVDVGQDLGGGRCGADQSEEDLERKIFV